jgi:Phosphotransferase enzyme family
MSMTDPAASPERIEALTHSLRRALGDTTLTVRPWRQGVDFWADRTQAGGQAAVLRSPRHEFVETSYEGVADFGDVIEREVTALGLMSAAGLPVPSVLGWQRGEPGVPPWVLLAHVEHDDDPHVPLPQLGELTRRVHDIRPQLPGLEPAGDWATLMCDRLFQRLGAARAYCSLPADHDLKAGIAELLRPRHSHATSLLHMDLRAANLCVREGRIAAIIDVANCMVGDPLLELGRIRRYGLLDDQFLGGYGLDVHRLGPDELTLLDIYELDTAALLTVVAVEEIDDAPMHAEQAAWTEYLASRIAQRMAAAR